MKKSNKFFGFTLAEVLITLGIIGVVAAITIPTLISSYKKNVYITQLKKTYSQLTQALKQMAADKNCGNDLICSGLFGTGNTTITLGDTLVTYLTTSKNCRNGTNQGCFSVNYNSNYDGTGTNNATVDSQGWWYKFITADGISIGVRSFAPNNCSDNWSTGRSGEMSQTCAEIFIDLNGAKGPNYWGRDIFSFYITNGKGAGIYQRGGRDDNTSGFDAWWQNNDTCRPNTTETWAKGGDACTGRLIEKNWEMDY